MLDAVAPAPLVQVLEEAAFKIVTAKSATKAAKTALSLIGNASCQMAKDRRKKVLKELNKDLQPLAEVEGTFAEVAPLLFGNGFEKQMKDHVGGSQQDGRKTQSSFFERAAPTTITHTVGVARTASVAEGDTTPTRGGEEKKIRRANGRSQSSEETETVTGARELCSCRQSGTRMFNPLYSVCICKSTRCSHVPPVVQKFLPSTLVQYLQGMGIAPLAKSLTELKVQLAGRIQHCLTN